MRVLTAFVALLLASPALAQQPNQSPLDQALSGKLMEEINQNIQYRAAVVSLNDQVTDLKKQLDTVKPKEAPKEPAKK